MTGRAIVNGVERNVVATTTAVIGVVWNEVSGRRVIQSGDLIFVVEAQ